MYVSAIADKREEAMLEIAAKGKLFLRHWPTFFTHIHTRLRALFAPFEILIFSADFHAFSLDLYYS